MYLCMNLIGEDYLKSLLWNREVRGSKTERKKRENREMKTQKGWFGQKRAKTLVFGSFCMFFAHFWGWIQGQQGLVDHVYFIADFWRFFWKIKVWTYNILVLAIFLRRFALHFSTKIVVKGVGDFATSNKTFDNRFMEYACFALYSFLENFLTDETTKHLFD